MNFLLSVMLNTGMKLSSFAQFVAPGEGRPNKVSIFLWNLGGFIEGKANEFLYEGKEHV